MPASRRVMPGDLLDTLMEHYRSPGRLADYRPRFERISRRPEEDLSVFVGELETLAMRAFEDLSSSARLQLVCDQFIVGQMECSLRRHLDGLEPGTLIQDIVERCCVWENHAEDTDCWGAGPILNLPLLVYPIDDVGTESGPMSYSDDQDLLESLMRHLLPTPAVLPPKVSSIPSEHEQFIQRLMGKEPPLRPLRGSITSWISNNDGPQIPVVSDYVPRPVWGQSGL